MGLDWKDVFPELTPPAGGVEALRERLGRETAQRPAGWHPTARARWVLSVAAAVTSIVVALAATWIISDRSGRRPLAASSNPTLIGLGLCPAPSEPVTVPESERGRIAVERIDTADPDVIFYRVAVLSSPEAPTAHGEP